MSENYEKFLAGQPLTEELAALKAGRLLPDPEPEAGPPLPDRVEHDRPLTRDDRVDLLEMRDSPGWTLFIRLQQKAIRKHEQSAITRSKSAPLANRDEIAQEWACLSLYERALAEMVALVNAEIEQLERDDAQ